MKVIIVGAGVGGLVTALKLHARGIDCEIFEQADALRELGVGINTLPHAIKELAELGLLERLDAVAIRTYELLYANRFGQEIWREPRGLDAGYDFPQFSIHRGRLQGVLYQAVQARLGEPRIHLSCRLAWFSQDDSGVTAYFIDHGGAHQATARGDVLVGADGIHSVVRDRLFPDEGPPRWNGLMVWRGAIEWPAFLTGRSMVVAGGLAAKLVVYPIAEGSRRDRKLTNWAVAGRVGDASMPPPQKQEWSRVGRFEDLMPHLQRYSIPYLDANGLIEATSEFWQYPMCDRDPLPRWSHGRVTLLGDAAHPMYPVGSNGASQAILDARFLADRLVDAEHPAHALRLYEQMRLPATAAIVQSNRRGGPEGVIDAVEELAPGGYTDIDAVLTFEQRKAIVGGYAVKAGHSQQQVNKPTRRTA